MADRSGEVVVNLAPGHEDADRVTIALLAATAALERGRSVVVFATKEAVRLGLAGYAEAIESAGLRRSPTPGWRASPRCGSGSAKPT